MKATQFIIDYRSDLISITNHSTTQYQYYIAMSMVNAKIFATTYHQKCTWLEARGLSSQLGSDWLTWPTPHTCLSRPCCNYIDLYTTCVYWWCKKSLLTSSSEQGFDRFLLVYSGVVGLERTFQFGEKVKKDLVMLCSIFLTISWNTKKNRKIPPQWDQGSKNQ